MVFTAKNVKEKEKSASLKNKNKSHNPSEHQLDNLSKKLSSDAYS